MNTQVRDGRGEAARGTAHSGVPGVLGAVLGCGVAIQHRVQPAWLDSVESESHWIWESRDTATLAGPAVPEYTAPSIVSRSTVCSVSNSPSALTTPSKVTF